VLVGDARELPRVLATRPRTRTGDGEARGRVAWLPYGRVDLVLTSPPYACEVGEVDKAAWRRGENLCAKSTRNYSHDRANLGHARGDDYLTAMADIYAACVRRVPLGALSRRDPLGLSSDRAARGTGRVFR